jgi:pimeloyl-ACP methyl ester carboxylesterase
MPGPVQIVDGSVMLLAIWYSGQGFQICEDGLTRINSEAPRPSLLLLPGNMCDASLWDGIRADLRARGWRMIDVDMTIDDSIADMAARALMSSSDPLVPIGFSMGGIVAIEMARQAPERIAAIAFLDTNPGSDLPERAAVRPGQQERVRAGKLETIVRDELKPAYLAEANRDNAPLKDHLLDMAMSLGPEVFIRQSEALRTRGDNWSVLPSLDRPALVACGAEDALCPPQWHQKIAAALPDARLHVVERSGHMLPLERPDALRDMLDELLLRLPVETAQ